MSVCRHLLSSDLSLIYQEFPTIIVALFLLITQPVYPSPTIQSTSITSRPFESTRMFVSWGQVAFFLLKGTTMVEELPTMPVGDNIGIMECKNGTQSFGLVGFLSIARC